jgi:hypothetical protein
LFHFCCLDPIENFGLSVSLRSIYLKTGRSTQKITAGRIS